MTQLHSNQCKFIGIPLSAMKALTDGNSERNIYVHPNSFARWIFWQRLQYAHKLLRKHVRRDAVVLDFGGGSGAFLPSLHGLFADLSVIDLKLADAERVAKHFNISDVSFYQQDINEFDEKRTFDLLVATDVFEHFSDMNTPYNFLQKYLKQDGYLLLTLPSENALYDMGRLLINKTKPADHYYSAREIVDFYESKGYSRVDSCYVPRIAGLAMPLFFVGLFRKGVCDD